MRLEDATASQRRSITPYIRSNSGVCTGMVDDTSICQVSGGRNHAQSDMTSDLYRTTISLIIISPYPIVPDHDVGQAEETLPPCRTVGTGLT